MRFVGRATVVAAGLTAALGGAQAHRMQPADLANLRTVANPCVSPDGRLVAYTVNTPTAAGKDKNQHIWLIGTDKPGTGRLFTNGAGSDSSPAWSPDGKALAFLSDRPNPLVEDSWKLQPAAFDSRLEAHPLDQDSAEKPAEDQKHARQAPPAPPDEPASTLEKNMQLWWIPLDGGEAQRLTSLPGGVRAFQWSKDGKRIAFIRTDPETPAQEERKKLKNDEVVLDHDFHFDRLWVLDVATDRAHQLTRDDQNVDTLDWSPDGLTLVARVSPTPRLNDYWRVSEVVIFDARNGAVRSVVEKNSGYQKPLYSLDGKQIAYSRFTQKGITDEHFVRTLASGQDLKLEQKLKGTIAELKWLGNGHLLVNAYVGAHTEANDVDLKNDVVTPITDLPPTTLDFDTTLDGQTKTFIGETSSQPPEVSVWRHGAVQVLSTTNPQVKDWKLGTEREVHWKNPNDHHVVYGVLSLPPGYTAGRPYKTVIHLHGGPEEAFTVGFNATWYNYAALLASHGYVVLQPNYRGSAGQEIAFTEGDYRDWGGKDFEDVMAGVDWLEQQKISDPQRLAVAGWSYGGFMTAWAITHTNRFKVAMAGAAVTDAFSMSLTTDIAPSYTSSYFGASSPAEYDQHSPVRFAAACQTPVLLLQGQSDVRVPPSQNEELYHALQFLGKKTEMVTYPREPHIFTEREHQIDSLARELSWFRQFLTPSNHSSQ